MAEPIPSARIVDRPTWQHWLAAADIVAIAVGVPIVLRYIAPPRTAEFLWAFHVLPIVALAAAIYFAVRAGQSPWTVALDPARPRDARRWIYVFFDIAFTAGYLITFEYFIPNRHAWATAALEILPMAVWLMAIGTLVARPWTWPLVVIGGAAMIVWLIVIMVVLCYTASYLSGVYGAFGQGASAGILGIMAVVVQFVALLPAFQLKWIMTRAGRRQFGLRPLWPAPPRRAPGPAVKAAA